MAGQQEATKDEEKKDKYGELKGKKGTLYITKDFKH